MVRTPAGVIAAVVLVMISRSLMSNKQLDLFAVAKAYCGQSDLSQESLYERLANSSVVGVDDLSVLDQVGKSGDKHCLAKRKIRWHQQTLKAMGLLERVGRGQWRLTAKAQDKLLVAQESTVMLAYATDLGIAIWGSCADVFGRSLGGQTITLCLTSPPYPLKNPRAYGNPKPQEYVDFICNAIEPIVRHLKEGGSIALNISNDIFMSRSPARSTYLERLVIALEDRLGLSLMDRLIWENPNKLPGPIAWASKTRYQLNAGYEPILWFSNNPLACTSNNQRVLMPHSEQHQKLIDRGGEKRHAIAGDGAYRLYPGSFGNCTAGKIPRNVLKFSGVCKNQRGYQQNAKGLGLQAHGASYPLALATFLVKFLSGDGDLVVDPFGGSMTTAVAAQRCGRRWIASEIVYDYIRGAATRFKGSAGFSLNPGFLN